MRVVYVVQSTFTNIIKRTLFDEYDDAKKLADKLNKTSLDNTDVFKDFGEFIPITFELYESGEKVQS
ncbi:hypothetical protein [Methanobrevibacter sp. DSM 116169]|uniref:hypothetical protein n=1 Tax=Methanobrevibacter sp. DSM 116169 TaxID=3242727 RepID=UPI0038FC10CC